MPSCWVWRIGRALNKKALISDSDWYSETCWESTNCFFLQLKKKLASLQLL